jgi:general stress protein 26
VNSHKNKEIKQDKIVQLFFAHAGKISYLIVNGEAEVIIDKQKTEESWSPLISSFISGTTIEIDGGYLAE